ncbi:MAG TPA: hypothetical protein GX401_05760 [Clostridiales bacterium]|nr:hypothetical protein [Clostridiales bacterium]
MKILAKVGAVVIAMAMVLSFAGCGGSGASSSSTSSAASSAASSTAESSKADSSTADAEEEEETSVAESTASSSLSEDDLATLIAISAIAEALQQDDTTTAVQSALVNGGNAAVWVPVAVSNGTIVMDKAIAEAAGATEMVAIFDGMNITFDAQGNCAMTSSSGTESGTYTVEASDIAITSADGTVNKMTIDATTGALSMEIGGNTLYFSMAVAQ